MGLFSHSDQQRAAQTLTCQYASASNKGAGGRLADALAAGLEKPGGGKPMVSLEMNENDLHMWFFLPCLFVHRLSLMFHGGPLIENVAILSHIIALSSTELECA